MIWHGSITQVAEQPSPLSLLPSSHSSSGSSVPSPQGGSSMQGAAQPSPQTVLPSSHSSPAPSAWLPPGGLTSRQAALSTKLRIVLATVVPNTRSTFASPPDRRWQ